MFATFSHALAIAALEAVRALLVGIAFLAYALFVAVIMVSAEQPLVVVIVVIAVCATLVIIAAVAMGIISASTVRFWVGINGAIDKQHEGGDTDYKQLINMHL
jgi:hypothetical protein